MLDRLTAGNERVTTRAVVEEIKKGVAAYRDLQDVIDLPWLRVVSADSLDELRLFAKYAARLGSGVHDVGEASVLAWAEAHGAIAFTDDEAAVQAGRDEGVEVRRTLAVVARGIKHGVLSDQEADRLVDELLRAGGRFPFGSGEFVQWARENGLV
jgi:predicted nucleic acid-binding protein